MDVEISKWKKPPICSLLLHANCHAYESYDNRYGKSRSLCTLEIAFFYCNSFFISLFCCYHFPHGSCSFSIFRRCATHQNTFMLKNYEPVRGTVGCILLAGALCYKNITLASEFKWYSFIFLAVQFWFIAFWVITRIDIDQSNEITHSIAVSAIPFLLFF